MLAVEEENEAYLLSAILKNNAIIDDLDLEPENFSKAKHQLLYKVIKYVHGKGLSTDPVVLHQELGDQLEMIGIDYLAQLYDYAPSDQNIDWYQEQILKNYREKQAAKIMNGWIVNPDVETISEVSRELDALVQVKDKEQTDSEVIGEIVDDLSQNRTVQGVTTGSADIDRITGGLQKGNLIVVGARVSVGKTAFSLNISRSAANSGVCVDFFSLEMRKKEIMQRILSCIGSIDMAKWKNPGRTMTQKDVQALMMASGIYAERWKMTVHAMDRPTVGEIRSRLETSIKDHPDIPHLAVIDYIKYIKPVGKFDRNDLAVGSIAEDLKMVARSLDMPIVLLVQINRGTENRQDKRPMMSDLKDSGDIEAAADVIFLLYRDDYYNRDADKDIAEINIAKNRNGPVGTVKMYFDKEHQQFFDAKVRDRM